MLLEIFAIGVVKEKHRIQETSEMDNRYFNYINNFPLKRHIKVLCFNTRWQHSPIGRGLTINADVVVSPRCYFSVAHAWKPLC